jgi:hypothetical protein
MLPSSTSKHPCGVTGLALGLEFVFHRLAFAWVGLGWVGDGVRWISSGGSSVSETTPRLFFQPVLLTHARQAG